MAFHEHKWLIEKTSPVSGHMLGVDKHITNLKTKYQQVEIADTQLYGRVLILDGKIQSAEYDEYVYHEALVHPVMLMTPAPRRVLVTGGGEGATLREIFKHPGVEKVVMVDLDNELVGLCREYLTSWHQGSFEDERLSLIYMDARKYLEECDEQYDVIIGDLPEPVEKGPALKLFTSQYYALIKKRLAENGKFALQAGDFSMPFIDVHSSINKTLQEQMVFVRSYKAFVPSFNTEWGFILAAPELAKLPDMESIDRIIAERELKLLFFDGEAAAGMFSIPRDIRRRIAEEERVIDDDNLIAIY